VGFDALSEAYRTIRSLDRRDRDEALARRPSAMTARARSRYADSQQLSDDAVADISRMVEEELQSIDFVHPVDFEILRNAWRERRDARRS